MRRYLAVFTGVMALVFASTAARADAGLIVAGTDVGGEPWVTVFDALSGDVLEDLPVYDEAFRGGVHVATGDVNGDGIPDIITGPGAGIGVGPVVNVYDGYDYSLFDSFYAYDPSFSGGVFVAAGDVNGDGYADIVTGTGPGGGPHVRVFDGYDGMERDSFFAYDASFTGGVTVAAGDVDGDGYADIITGAGAGGGPVVNVFSGVDLAVIDSFFAYDETFPGGVFVAAGDYDGDDFVDVITGAGAGGGPDVRVFAGIDGQLIENFFALEAEFTGGIRVASADVDGDGLADIVTGAGSGGGPIASVFGSVDTEPLDFYAFDPSFTGGLFVAATDATGEIPHGGGSGSGGDGSFTFELPDCGVGVTPAMVFTMTGVFALRFRRSAF